jgi:hypothetical protein
VNAAHRDSYAIAGLSVNSMGLALAQHLEYYNAPQPHAVVCFCVLANHFYLAFSQLCGWLSRLASVLVGQFCLASPQASHVSGKEQSKHNGWAGFFGRSNMF